MAKYKNTVSIWKDGKIIEVGSELELTDKEYDEMVAIHEYLQPIVTRPKTAQKPTVQTKKETK